MESYVSLLLSVLILTFFFYLLYFRDRRGYTIICFSVRFSDAFSSGDVIYAENYGHSTYVWDDIDHVRRKTNACRRNVVVLRYVKGDNTHFAAALT